MSDSIIRVKNSSNNFIDRNLLVSSYKRKKKGEKLTDLEIRRRREMPLMELKWNKQKEKLANQRKQENQSFEKKKIEKKKRKQQKEQQAKKMNDLIFYSDKVANDIDNQRIYRKKFLDKYPGHPSQKFKNFASMYNAIVNKRKMTLIGSEYEIIFLLKHFKKTNNELLLFRFINKLYRYDNEFQNTLTNSTKACCNKFLKLYQKEELFNLSLKKNKFQQKYK